MADQSVISLFGRLPSRVHQLVSDRAPTLLSGRAADPPGDGKVICRGCGAVAELGTVEVCLWWPFGCRTRATEPYPRLCWGCCDDDERADLVDAGCHDAAAQQRLGVATMEVRAICAACRRRLRVPPGRRTPRTCGRAACRARVRQLDADRPARLAPDQQPRLEVADSSCSSQEP